MQGREKSDLELVKEARAGDKTAFEALVTRSEAKVRRLALNMTGNAEIAGELVQEAMLQAYLSLPLLRNEASFKSWFYGITLNVVRGYLRENKPARQFDTVPDHRQIAGPDHYDPSSLAEKRELYRRVLLAIGQLSPGNREAIRLYYFEELGLAQIATVLGISVTAVKGRLHKARQALKEQIVKSYPELAVPAPAAPLKAKQRPAKERKRPMVEVTISDVMLQKKIGDMPHMVIILLDKAANRFVPVWVGQHEGEHIAVGLRQFPTPRPMTYSFIEKILEATGAKLEEVRIDSLKNDTFYGIARLQVNEKNPEIDVRPSDALALAVRIGCPIYIHEEVFEKAGVPLANLEEKLGPDIEGMDSILNDLKIKLQSAAGQLKSTVQVPEA
jgi:RNA polymerase sigma factor (sigma-70 family)